MTILFSILATAQPEASADDTALQQLNLIREHRALSESYAATIKARFASDQSVLAEALIRYTAASSKFVAWSDTLELAVVHKKKSFLKR